MGINVVLEDESGNVVDGVPGQGSLPTWLIDSTPELGSTHCIQYINFYGDTVFNTLQMDRFLDEWKVVESQAMSEDEKALVAEIRRLASICQTKCHLYLKFIGD